MSRAVVHCVRVRQARGVGEGRAAHAQRAGTQGHHLGEPVLGAAEQFAERRRRVVGRLGDQAQDRLLDRQPRARQQTELGGSMAAARGETGTSCSDG